MMMEGGMAMGPPLGNLLVAGFGALVTAACFVALFRMLLHPGEERPDHPKRRILAPDR